jgi:hypothetical protein
LFRYEQLLFDITSENFIIFCDVQYLICKFFLYTCIYAHTTLYRYIYILYNWLIDWLIIYGFTARSRIFHLYGDVTISDEGVQNLGLCLALIRPMLGAQSLRAGRDLYRATPAMTRDLSFYMGGELQNRINWCYTPF